MNPHDVAAELRARAERARADVARSQPRSAARAVRVGKADAYDDAASLVESAARAECWGCDGEGAIKDGGKVGEDCPVCRGRTSLPASTESAPAEEARAIEAHICLDCGTIYDRPTVCKLNGADSPTVPVRDAIQSHEPTPAVREEARVEALKAALEWVADNYPAAITAMPTSLFRPLRESPVESSQEARRVCTCNAIDTPHGPAPDEKTPGCPVHSPAPTVREEERADPKDIATVIEVADYLTRKGWPDAPGAIHRIVAALRSSDSEGRVDLDDPHFTVGQMRGALDVIRSGLPIDRDRLETLIVAWIARLEPASTRVREDDEADHSCSAGDTDCAGEDDEARVSEDDLDVLTKFQRIMRSWNRQHEVEAVDRILAALEPPPPTLKGEDDGAG